MIEVTEREQVESKARGLAEPLLRPDGIELLDVEFLREREGWVLRLVIDKEGGVRLDDCAAVSRLMGPVFDVEDLVDRAYRLEVSSPGVNRPLKKPEHFLQVEGKRVKVKTFGAIGEPPRRRFTGTLKGLMDNSIFVEVEGAGEFRIPLAQIAKANLEFEFNSDKEPL